MFCSASKPTSPNDYLSDFMFEMKNFELNCFEYENNKYIMLNVHSSFNEHCRPTDVMILSVQLAKY